MGPAPTPHRTADPRLSGRRAAVLEQLRAAAGARTAGELAAQMSLHPNTVREHLDALVDLALVGREAETPEGRGRPAWRYLALEGPEQDVRVRDYAGLAAALAGQIARTSSDPSGDALVSGSGWGRELAAGRRSAPGSAAGSRREVVALLDELGFAPAADRRAATVRLRQCPLLAAAERYPEVVCSVHLGIVQGALAELGGDPSRASLQAFAEPGACLLELDAAAPGG